MFSRRAQLLEKNPPREGERVISTLKPYPAYKDSGVEWLGQVPEHWEVLPGRTVFREINDRGHPDEQMLSVTITRGVLRQADLLADSSKKDSSNEDKSNYKLVQPGDLVYNKMRAWQGAVGVSAYRGIVSPAYIVQRLRSAENLPRYMHFLLRTPLFASEAERWSYGITSDQWSLRAEEFKCIYFSLPPLLEQTAIVRFLDWAGRRIRLVIRAWQRRIKLLEEYKQALIHQAVTGKIDVRTGKPYPAYQDSGVPWLGQVPEHWEVMPVKRALRPQSCGNAAIKNTAAATPLDGYAPAFSASGQDVWLPRASHSGSALVLSAVGARCGKTFKADGQWGVVANTHILWPRTGQNRDYWWYVTNNEAWWDKAGAAQPFVRVSATLERCWVIPPQPEQTAIVEYLDAQTSKLDTAIAVARREIELLREYRERLIADVVTGKVDVREVAARLPEEPPEEEAEWMDMDEIAEGEATDDDAAAEALPAEGVEA
jgi:type I restriction enzyme S subunit